MIKTLIVEDDPLHCRTLEALLMEVTPKVHNLAVCSNVEDAYLSITTLKPDLVFLDIDLDNGDNGFELLKKFDHPDFAVIFTTQHNNTENAIAAIRVCALDFLPKPVILSDLKEAFRRLNKLENIQQTNTLKDNLSDPEALVDTIWIADTEGKTKIKVSDVMYCKSSNVWTSFYLSNPVDRKTTYTSSQTIKQWEHNLLASSVLRVHNEYLVNLSHVEKYKNRMSGSAEVILRSGISIPVSKSRKNTVKDRLKLFK